MKRNILLILLFSFGITVSFAQKIGIGTNSPTATLDVNGNIRIRGGNPGAGKVLTSDANGNATWSTENFAAFRVNGLLDGENVTLIQSGWLKILYAQFPQYNIGLGYSGLSGNFVAPYKGLYHFDARVDLLDQQWEVHMRLMQKRGNSVWEAAYLKNTAVSTAGNGVYQMHNMLISTDLMVEQGDTFWIEVYSHGAPNIRVNGAARGNWFNAHMIKAL